MYSIFNTKIKIYPLKHEPNLKQHTCTSTTSYLTGNTLFLHLALHKPISYCCLSKQPQFILTVVVKA